MSGSIGVPDAENHTNTMHTVAIKTMTMAMVPPSGSEYV